MDVRRTTEPGFETTFSHAEQQLDAVAAGLNAAMKALATARKAVRVGDVQTLSKSFQAVRSALAEAEPALNGAGDALLVDYTEAMRSGDFAREVAALATKSNLNGVRVVYGQIFSFPVVLTPQAEKQAVRIGKKLYRTLRPSTLIARLASERKRKPSQARLIRLIDAIERSYLDASGGRSSVAVKIAEVYDRLTPLPEQKTDYTQTDFVADCYALERANILESSNRRILSFPASTSARSGNAIRITTEEGDERLYSSLRFD